MQRNHLSLLSYSGRFIVHRKTRILCADRVSIFVEEFPLSIVTSQRSALFIGQVVNIAFSFLDQRPRVSHRFSVFSVEQDVLYEKVNSLHLSFLFSESDTEVNFVNQQVEKRVFNENSLIVQFSVLHTILHICYQ